MRWKLVEAAVILMGMSERFLPGPGLLFLLAAGAVGCIFDSTGILPTLGDGSAHRDVGARKDGKVLPPDRTVPFPERAPDRGSGAPDRTVPPPDRTVPPPDRKVPPPDRKVPPPDRKVPPPDQKVPPPDQKVPPPDIRNTSCDALFGSTPGYYLCSESPTECRFFRHSPYGTSDKSCNAICGDHTCLGADDTDSSYKCSTYRVNCASTHHSSTCRCSRD